MLTWPRAIVGALAAAVLVLPLAFERLSPAPAEMVDVRFLESIRFSLLSDAYPDPDRINALVLAGGCGLATMAAALVRGSRSGRATGTGAFFVVTAVAIGVLAVEEMFELTEALAAALAVDALRVDLLAPLIGLAIVVRYRRLLARSRRALALGAAGVAGLVFSLLSDNLELGRLERLEDPLESVASVLLMTAFVVLTLDLLAEPQPAEAIA